MQIPRLLRGLWDRTNLANLTATGGFGFKDNTPDGWVDTSGPVWWVGSDHASAYRGGPPSGFSAVTKATSVIVNRITSGEWTADGGAPRWLSDPMLTRPDDRFPASPFPTRLRLPASLFWGQWIRSTLLWGMGWMLVQLDQQGQPYPGSMLLLAPDAVDASDGRQLRTSMGDRVVFDDDNQTTIEGGRWRLLEMRNPITPLDPATGTTPGVLQHHAAELGLLGAITDYAAGTFTGAGVPSGYLKASGPQMSQAQVDALKADWMAVHGSGRRSVAVLNATLDYQAIAASPVDLGLVQMKQLTLTDVAHAFGMPLSVLGAPTGDSLTYSNVLMDQQALWLALLPWVKAVEEPLSALLPAGRNVRITMPDIPGGGFSGAAVAGDAGRIPDLPEG